MRHTRAHTKNRRSHHALKGIALTMCKNCSELRRMHTVCMNCGQYKGRQVIDVTKSAKKALKAAKAAA